MKREDIIREVQSMLPGLGISGGYQVAKAIVKLAEHPAPSWPARKKFWYASIGVGMVRIARWMLSTEAATIVSSAKARIEAADEGETNVPRRDQVLDPDRGA